MSEVVENISEEALLRKANDARDDGENELYSEILSRLVNLKPQNRLYHHEYIHSTIKLQDFDKAEKLSLAAHDMFGEDAHFLMERAFIADQTANWEQSVLRRKDIIARFPPKEFPSSTKAIAEMIHPLCEMGKRKEAKDLIFEQWDVLIRDIPRIHILCDVLEELNLPEFVSKLARHAGKKHESDFVEKVNISNTLLLARESIQNKRFMLDLNEHVNVISLGQNCLPYSIPARWGINIFAGFDHKISVFDYGGFPNETSGEMIEENFKSITSEDNYEIVISPPKTPMLKLKGKPIVFFHERGSYWVKDEITKFIDHMREKIRIFYDSLKSQKKLFIYCICGPCNLDRLISKVEPLLTPGSRLVLLNVLSSDLHFNGRSGVSYYHIPYPTNYSWNFAEHYSSDRGFHFEFSLIRALKNEILHLQSRS